jgi:transcriptional regulator with XRE-family HTH domain
MLTRDELGRRIAEERRRAGVTQDELARALGLERTAVTRIEQGRQGVDSLQLSVIADTLGRPPAVFFEPASEEPLAVLLRAPDARRDDVRHQIAWLDAFVRDYEFLRRVLPERA